MKASPTACSATRADAAAKMSHARSRIADRLARLDADSTLPTTSVWLLLLLRCRRSACVRLLITHVLHRTGTRGSAICRSSFGVTTDRPSAGRGRRHLGLRGKPVLLRTSIRGDPDAMVPGSRYYEA